MVRELHAGARRHLRSVYGEYARDDARLRSFRLAWFLSSAVGPGRAIAGLPWLKAFRMLQA